MTTRRMPASRPAFAPLATLVAAALAGCAAGPDYQPPTLDAPQRFQRDESPPGTQAAAPLAADTGFWRQFNDPQLDALVAQALRANHDLRAALANLDRANALLGAARLDRLPTVTARAEGGRERLSQDQSYGFDRSHATYQAHIAASWEIDLFGRVRRDIEARRAEAGASAHDLAALQVAVAADTATTYLQLRGLQQRLRVLRESLDRLRQMRELIDARVSAGRGTELDTTRAQAQLEITAARLPALEAQVAMAQHRLAVLTGRQPQALVAELDPPRALPEPPPAIGPDAPADLLRRRPDVAAAEQRLHAATARVGVATADLFPRLSLGGLIGTQAFDAGALFKSGSETGRVLLGIDWSFLDVGRVRSRIAAAGADAAGRLAQYQQAVLLALEDTENALVRYSRTRAEDEHLMRAARDAARAVELAKLRYQAGKIELFELLGAERDLLAAQDAFADCRTRSAVAGVALFKALAGGWPQQLPDRHSTQAAPARTAL
ncbi:MAG: efflux transporter outer membrane subunit [Pseudomonadota bacterium]